ncbi:MAG: hypothetical protein IKB58_02495, partial [Oscillospiraceae bacterium]|nr:hypothetical protein [Oscillospiraceae bacterium]
SRRLYSGVKFAEYIISQGFAKWKGLQEIPVKTFVFFPVIFSHFTVLSQRSVHLLATAFFALFVSLQKGSYFHFVIVDSNK